MAGPSTLIADLVRASVDPALVQRVHDEIVAAWSSRQPDKAAQQPYDEHAIFKRYWKNRRSSNDVGPTITSVTQLARENHLTPGAVRRMIFPRGKWPGYGEVLRPADLVDEA